MGSPFGDAIFKSVAPGVIYFRGFFLRLFKKFWLNLDRPRDTGFNEICPGQDPLVVALHHDLAVLVNKDLADLFLKLFPDRYRRTLSERFDPLF